MNTSSDDSVSDTPEAAGQQNEPDRSYAEFWKAAGGPPPTGWYTPPPDPDPADPVAVLLFWSMRVFRPWQLQSNKIIEALDVGLPRDFPYLWSANAEERVCDALTLTISVLEAMTGGHAAVLWGEAIYLRSRFRSWPNVTDRVEVCRRLDEFRAEYERAVSLAKRPAVAPLPPPAPPPNQPEQSPTSFYPLAGFPAIFACLNEGSQARKWKDDAKHRHLLREMNAKHNGPIQFGKKGQRPTTSRDALLRWAAGLADEYDKVAERMKQKADDTEATVQKTHPYARSGDVVPGVGGSVKKPRTNRRGEGGSDEVE